MLLLVFYQHFSFLGKVMLKWGRADKQSIYPYCPILSARSENKTAGGNQNSQCISDSRSDEQFPLNSMRDKVSKPHSQVLTTNTIGKSCCPVTEGNAAIMAWAVHTKQHSDYPFTSSVQSCSQQSVLCEHLQRELNTFLWGIIQQIIPLL